MRPRSLNLPDAHIAAGKLDIKNVIYPILWLALITVPTSLILAFLASGIKAIFFSFFAIACVGSVIYFYNFFAKSNPDYLRSEKFHIQRIQLTTLGEKSQNMDTESIEKNSETPVITSAQPLFLMDETETNK